MLSEAQKQADLLRSQADYIESFVGLGSTGWARNLRKQADEFEAEHKARMAIFKVVAGRTALKD